jgi:LmbE family N-acetylglucosaminyl deacetylase
MNFHNPTAEIFVPDGQPVATALRRVTHLGIGAHQDDLEFMAFHGIIAGYGARSFAGLTCTNGGGSARSGPFAGYTDAQMMAVRRQEQRQAAILGRYAAMIQLDYPSAVVKNPRATELTADLTQILAATRPRVVYTHNPADKHDTHVAVVMATVRALRALPVAARPAAVYGCEVWRDLDWVPDAEKVLLDVTGYEALARELNGVFVSQIAGGKRYDLAVLGRRRANATFMEAHATDQAAQVCVALDLTPLVREPAAEVVEYVTGFVRRFEADVQQRLLPWK